MSETALKSSTLSAGRDIFITTAGISDGLSIQAPALKGDSIPAEGRLRDGRRDNDRLGLKVSAPRRQSSSVLTLFLRG
jgi:hypothetical protein